MEPGVCCCYVERVRLWRALFHDTRHNVRPGA